MIDGSLKPIWENQVEAIWGDEDHAQRSFNFHPVFIPLNKLLVAILDCGIWPPARRGHNGLRPGGIADLLYRCALSVFIKLTEYLKSKI